MKTRAAAFVAVGGMGFLLQLGVLTGLTHVARWPYPIATAAAVEITILHNFFWHRRWTWRDRSACAPESWRRLAWFHVSAGLASLIGNVVLTTAFVELLGVPAPLANAGAVAVMALANYRAADRWIFRLDERRPTAPPRRLLRDPHGV